MITGIFILLLLLLCGCEDFAQADPDQAVVEGFLHANRTAEIKVNRQLVFSGGDTTFSQPLSMLHITFVNESTGKSETLVETEAGVYCSQQLIAEENTYTLSFEYAGKNVRAQTTVPSHVTGFEADGNALLHTERFSEDTLRYVNYRWENEYNDFHLMQITHMESWVKPIYNTAYTPSFTITSSPTQDTTFQVNSRGFHYYGRHYMILYKLNQEYVDLYYENSSNSQHLTNPPTNIQNGFGIFTGMSSDTLLLQIL